MRIVTRPDFDGVVCAVLLFEAENIDVPVKWVEPNEMQGGLVDIQQDDIIANLPYDDRCALWFDHHYTNKINKTFKGAFKIAPSAAGIIFDYYSENFRRDYSELIKETDKIDAADLSLDEVLHPENYPYLLLSMTVSDHNKADEFYWNRLIDLLRKYEIEEVLEDSEVKQRCLTIIQQNMEYREILKENTKLKAHISITDFRSFNKTPIGNRFLVYSLFPESVVNIKIRYDNEDREKLIVSVGHSIFNRNCNVNVGLMLSRFNGGGHGGAGACTFHVSKADDYIPKIIEILLRNEPQEDYVEII
ncbi:MAG: exopolyphosphatase [Desulfobacterales bacterium]|nr:exopolyphosphatase [Desulfobacterales bacterium]